jgi:hypothetical protein
MSRNTMPRLLGVTSIVRALKLRPTLYNSMRSTNDVYPVTL